MSSNPTPSDPQPGLQPALTDASPLEASSFASSTYDRRRFMAGAGVSVLVVAGASFVIRDSLWSSSASAAAPPHNVLINVFMRGGADGLSILPPVGETAYHDLRPTIHLKADAALPVDSRFGLFPSATGLKTLFDASKVAFVPACAVPQTSRSHFEAQDRVERAAGIGGWLTRHLQVTGSPVSPLGVFSFSNGAPMSLRGSSVIAAPSPQSLAKLQLGASAKNAYASAFAASSNPLLKSSSQAALAALTEAATVPSTALPAGWSTSSLGRVLWATKLMLEAGVGVEVVSVDTGGWDTHTAMGDPSVASSKIAKLVTDNISDPLASFFGGLSPADASRVTLLMMSEFGRRAGQNDSGGLDHGTGGVVLVAGAGVSGGVKGAWPGLAPSQLVSGDVACANDSRLVMAEICAKRLGNTNLAATFPGLDTSPSRFLGVCL